jgi:hypothetical protein
MSSVDVWDIETLLDIKGFAAANGALKGAARTDICALRSGRNPG